MICSTQAQAQSDAPRRARTPKSEGGEKESLPCLGGETVAAEGQVNGAEEEAAVAAAVVLPEGRQVRVPAVVAPELAAHLEDAGGGRAAGGERCRQRDEEEEEQQRRNKGSARGATTAERLHFSGVCFA